MSDYVQSFRVCDREGTWLEWNRPGVAGWRLASYRRHLGQGVYQLLEERYASGRSVTVKSPEKANPA